MSDFCPVLSFRAAAAQELPLASASRGGEGAGGGALYVSLDPSPTDGLGCPLGEGGGGALESAASPGCRGLLGAVAVRGTGPLFVIGPRISEVVGAPSEQFCAPFSERLP